MDKMRTSGIIGMIAFFVGILGFTMSWVDLYLFDVVIANRTGFDILGEEFNDATLILLLLLGGLLVSLLCFVKSSIVLRVAFVLLGLGIIAISIVNLDDVTMYAELPILGKSGTLPGIGLYMELVAGIILVAAAAFRKTVSA